MQKHVEEFLNSFPKDKKLNVLNVGFGLGIIDSIFQVKT